MNAFYPNRSRGGVVLATAILILLLSGVASYRGLVEFSEIDRWVRHTHEVLEAIQSLQIDMGRLRADTRGFVITGDEAYAERCRSNGAKAELDEASIARLTVDNPRQQARLPAIKSLVGEQIQFEERVIQIRRTGAIQAVIGIRLGAGEALTARLQDQVFTFENEERSLLALRDKNSTRRMAAAMRLLAFGTCLGLVIALAAGGIVRRDDRNRREAERALRESEQQYRTILDGVQDHAVYMLDPVGQVKTWNTGAERIKGYSAEEIVGQNFSRFFTPEDLAAGKPEELLRLTAAAGHHEERGIRIRADGSQFPCNISLTAFHDGHGNVRGFVKISRDLTESVNSAEKYRRLLEAAPDAMMVVDRKGEILQLNVFAEKAFGYVHDELVGRHVECVLPGGVAAGLFPDKNQAAAPVDPAATPEPTRNLTSRIEFLALRKDGREYPVEVNISPLESAGRNLLAMRDISARKEAEAHLLEKLGQLKQSNEELEKFAYIASHDLQEPLRMVASYTQLLARRYKGKLDADADDFIAYAVDGSVRMQRLIQDLLVYSRIGTEGKQPQRTAGEDMLNQALFNLKGAIEDSGAIVTHEPMPTVLADKNQLVQLFQNLIGNGIKYQDRNADIPRIHVSAKRSDGKRWVFSVKDNGLGINPQYFERIFGMFQRLHKREEFGGTGIGLAICKKIAERHGGSIWVESQLGQGSTFHFALTGE